MERYALVRHLQRQRQLVRRMAPGQPLSAYVAQHRLLPAAIGPMPEAPAPASLPRRFVPGEDARAVQSMDAVLPTLEPPALNTVEKRSAALAEQNTAQQPAQEMMKHERSMPNIVATQHTPAPPRHSIQVENRNSASVLKMAQAEEQAAREQVQWLEQPNAKAEQPALPEPARVEQDARALDVHAFDMQPVNVAAALAPAAASQQELPARRRARIEEWPLPLPGSSSAQVKRTNAEMIHRPEDARHLAKAEQKTETEHEADALFTSSTPGRSPQEWFALLTQAEQKPQPATSVNVAAALAPVAGQAAGARAAATFTTSAQFKRVSHQPMREPHPMQSRSTRTMSEQVAVPRLLASASGETNAAQFVPAQQQANSQSFPPGPVARSSDDEHRQA
ncbi:MAG TPA: hypothetical protein VH164_10755, partial [Ktedonobacteraceae bacterium]|nr:hypothetical protein [Ktedonobacteraceae bacterium]